MRISTPFACFLELCLVDGKPDAEAILRQAL
jgi:hypothetical protein